jgi:hypothetical protein
VVQAGAGKAMARQASAAVKPETAGPPPKDPQKPLRRDVAPSGHWYQCTVRRPAGPVQKWYSAMIRS